MKLLQLICLVAFLLPNKALAEPVQWQADFRAANERALKGEYAQAISLYQSLLERGAQGADVHYNLGNALAEDGQWVNAIVHYEESLRLDPSAEDTQQNLAKVRRKLLGKAPEKEADNLALAEVLAPIVQLFDVHLALYLGLATNFIFFLLLALRKGSGFKALSLALSILAFSWVGAHYYVSVHQEAVVVESGPVKEGPSSAFKSSSQGKAGYKVRLLQQESGWWEIQFADGTTGWMPIQNIRILGKAS